MRGRVWGSTLVGVAALFLGLPAVTVAQDDSGMYVRHDEDDWEETEHRYALGIGFGLVNIDEDDIRDDDVEPYYALNFRIGVFGRPARTHASRRFGMRGYLEPELGYWSQSSRGISRSDLLLGLNLIGSTPVGPSADFFVGGGIGYHFADDDFNATDDSLGVNAQFGADIFVARRVSLFAVGRFDLVDDRDDLEAKAYVGARFYF